MATQANSSRTRLWHFIGTALSRYFTSPCCFRKSAATFLASSPLVSGEPRALWQIWAFTPLLLGAALASTVALAFWPGRTALWLTFLLSEALFIVLFWSAGQAATQMAAVESPLARTSVGSGLWLWLALCLLVCSDAIRRLTPQPVWRWLLNAQFWVIPLLILLQSAGQTGQRRGWSE